MSDQANQPEKTSRRAFLQQAAGAVVGALTAADAVAQITGGTVDSLPPEERAKVLAGQAGQPATAEPTQAAPASIIEQVAELRKAAAKDLMGGDGVGLRALSEEQREALRTNLSDNQKGVYFVPGPQNPNIGLLVYQTQEKDSAKNLTVVYKNVQGPYNGAYHAGHLQQMKGAGNKVGIMRGGEVQGAGFSAASAYSQAEKFIEDMTRQPGQPRQIPGVPDVGGEIKKRLPGIFRR